MAKAKQKQTPAEVQAKNEKSLLLYLESRAVDGAGLAEGLRMNAEDFAIAKQWNDSGYVRFGRLKMNEIKARAGWANATHYVRLSDAAWSAAHEERRAQAIRCESALVADNIARHEDTERISP